MRLLMLAVIGSGVHLAGRALSALASALRPAVEWAATRAVRRATHAR